jgi:hypothetical protein
MWQIVHRVGNHVFTAIATASLMVWAITLVLWPLGHWRRLYVNYCFGMTQVGIQTEAGTLAVGGYQYPRAVTRGWSRAVHDLDESSYTGLLDFGHLHKERNSPGDNLFGSM